MSTTSAPVARRAEWLPGAILITIGLILFAAQYSGQAGEAIPLAIGIVFALSYVATRSYGLLVPAGILTGLGAGILAEDYVSDGMSVVLGLGLGFIAIYVVDAIVTGAAARWWPLIPGGILVTVAGAQLAYGDRGLEVIGDWWPAILIIAGLLLLTRRFFAPRA